VRTVAGVEHLVRYCARPPFAHERLHALDTSPAFFLAREPPDLPLPQALWTSCP